MSERKHSISNIHIEDAPKVKGVGLIEEVRFSDVIESDNPLMNGAEYVTLIVRYPNDAVDSETYSASMYYNENRFGEGADNSDLTPGQQQMIHFAKIKINALKKATGVDFLEDLEGKEIEFSYGPQKDDPTRGEFKSFKPAK